MFSALRTSVKCPVSRDKRDENGDDVRANADNRECVHDIADALVEEERTRPTGNVDDAPARWDHAAKSENVRSRRVATAEA